MGFRHKKAKQVNTVVLLPVTDIVSNRSQPRRCFGTDDLSELSNSIHTNGLLQPITVRRLDNGTYELISGERRTMAFRQLGREFIPAIVEKYTDEQSAVLALIENLQRKDLNCFEEATGIARLMEEIGLTQQEISQRLGRSQSTVANKLRLLKFPPCVRERIINENLTERHARALLKLTEEQEQLEAIDAIVQFSYTVEQTENYVAAKIELRDKKPTKRLFIIKDMRIFLNSINKAVETMRDAGIPVDADKSEDEECVEYHIRIPKASVYHHPSAI